MGKRFSAILLILFMVFSISMKAQDSTYSKKILYKYTFEGMKDSSEISKLTDYVLQLKGMINAKVVFKSAEHKYAQLQAEVIVPEKFDENTPDVTGPYDLKKLLIYFGYIPAECITYHED